MEQHHHHLVEDIHTDQILRVSTPPPINALRKKPTKYLRALVLMLASFITVGPLCVFVCMSMGDGIGISRVS